MEMEYARRCPRLVASIINVVIVVVVLGMLNVVGVIDTFVVEEGESVPVLHVVIQGLIGLGYFTVLTAVWGATLGKMAMGMRVADENGIKPGVGAVLLRQFIVGGLAPLPAVMLGMNGGGGISGLVTIVVVFWILIDDRRQGLHDKLARTFVARA